MSGDSSTDLGIETAAGKRRCAASQWKRIWKGRRRAKRVNRLCKTNSEAQKLTMTGIHPVQIYGHTAQGASNAQVDAMCRNLKLGTVSEKTQACPITPVAWFFGVKRVPQTAARVSRSASGSLTRDAESADFGGKSPCVGRKSPSLESGHGTYLCHQLLGVGSRMEAELTRFLAVTGWKRHSGRRRVQQGADHRQFLQ